MLGPRSDAEAADWLVLIRSENVGPATFFDLLKRFGSAGEALAALPELAAKAGLKRPIRIARREDVEKERAIAKREGLHHLFFGGPGYPARLAAIHAPPPVVTVRGAVDILHKMPVAVVGARKASAAGLTLAQTFAAAFAASGRAVVSGLALGIDAAAHQASLEAGTVAVVAGGVDRPTPEENRGLCEEIVANGGAIVSEMPLGMMPFARDYPRRNRLIAGLSDGVLVIEAAANSGSLHTARFASNESREVFAVPGSPLDPRAAGCLELLRDGATIAIEPNDVLSMLRADFAPPQMHLPGFSEDGAEFPLLNHEDPVEAVAEVLSLTPVPLDQVVRATALSAASVAAAIVDLELSGRALREGDGTVRALVTVP